MSTTVKQAIRSLFCELTLSPFVPGSCYLPGNPGAGFSLQCF